MEKNLNTPPTQLYNIHYDMKTLFDSLPYTKSFAKGENKSITKATLQTAFTI